MVSAFCKIINWLIYGFVTHAAAAWHALHIISDVSKLESWWMASMHITNSQVLKHFSGRAVALLAQKHLKLGQKGPKISPKRS